MDDDILEIDSPENEVVDDVVDDAEEDSPLDDLTTTSAFKLPRPVEKPRHQQLEYIHALPYETESLDEMDHK